MQKIGLNELREKFLSFFESKEHLRLPSFSLVPVNDPSILLINAGMTPLKPYFTGQVVPPAKRITTCQKCIRTPDIDNVGLTSGMEPFLRCWEISLVIILRRKPFPAWEFFVDVLGIHQDRLYVSVYLEDDEAYDIWHHDVGLPKEKIFKMGKEDILGAWYGSLRSLLGNIL